MGLAGSDDVIVRPILLQHQPHRFDVIAGKAPVALRVEITQREPILQPELDPRGTAGDFPRDKILTAARRFVIEEDAVGCEQAVSLAMIHGLPMRVALRARVGTTRMKRGGLSLRNL